MVCTYMWYGTMCTFFTFVACSTADCKVNAAVRWTRVYKLELRRSRRRTASGKDSVSDFDSASDLGSESKSESRGCRATLCRASAGAGCSAFNLKSFSANIAGIVAPN